MSNVSENQADLMLKEIQSIAAQSREDVRVGKEVDLSGLDKKVASFCEVVLALDPEASRKFDAPMDRLRQELTALGQQLEQAKQEVVGQMDQLNLQKKAQHAYATSTNSTAPAQDSSDQDKNATDK